MARRFSVERVKPIHWNFSYPVLKLGARRPVWPVVGAGGVCVRTQVALVDGVATGDADYVRAVLAAHILVAVRAVSGNARVPLRLCRFWHEWIIAVLW
jgi:hypothetical protein